ncbi:hypothetical protein PsorP6_009714 [Peronosclerospora sorghi]|uniref:Uncharacterized protein n=1 Tax=Peronosclerospora sorghi TaxID=230839 RepID=A0ACC0W262_9STRA|nr:hypothetical protein PsorP6_009714 [Peronosclerospora sorghi]
MRVPEDQLDDKIRRRRQQYKFHQRRHRAKQKEKLITLSHDVDALCTEIYMLNQKRHALLVDRSCFSARGTENGVPARLAIEYFRLFEYGILPTKVTQQEHFLRSVMTEKTVGPDYAGVETVITRWKGFREFFVYTRYELLALTVSPVAESTIVLIDTHFHIGCSRDGILTLFPTLVHDVDLLQKLIGAKLVVPVQYRFEVDANGLVTWFSADWDLIRALNGIVSLVDATSLLATTKITKTGKIQTTGARDSLEPCATPRPAEVAYIEEGSPSSPSSTEDEWIDPRFSLAFLLS